MSRLYAFFILVTAWLPSSAYRIDTLIITSNYMDEKITNLVVLPDNYYETDQEFPVLYLLHGAYGDYSDWVKKAPEVPDFTDRYNFIIVCPEGGYNSWYFDSPVDSSLKIESYIADEVVNTVGRLYRTKKTPQSRGISGLSMGGHGAFKSQEIKILRMSRGSTSIMSKVNWFFKIIQ